MTAGGKRAAAGANRNEWAITEGNIFDSEQRGADLTKKPAQRVKKGTYLAKALEKAAIFDVEDRVSKEQHTKLQQAYAKMEIECKQALKRAAAMEEDNARLAKELRIAKFLAAFDRSTVNGYRAQVKTMRALAARIAE
ncbi:g6960 [Coccomyxa viridis]|uniref:G6960 protein n=1 Tax=Coccomyxa viridis TaxID=1274662 RepID=A0ABP1FZ03_9CHLO